MPTWPGTLPIPERADYSEKPRDNKLTSKPDMGAVRRRRFTATATDMRFELRCSSEQALALLDFFNNTTQGGTLSFTYTSTWTGALFSKTLFAVGYVPDPRNIGGDRWAVTVELEAWP